MRLLAGRALRLSVALAGMLTAAGAFAHAHLQQQIPTAGAQLSASTTCHATVYSPGGKASAKGNVTSAGLSALRVSFPVATACCCGPVTVTPARLWHYTGLFSVLQT